MVIRETTPKRMVFSQNGNDGHKEGTNPMRPDPIGKPGEPGPLLPQLAPHEDEGNPDRRNGHRPEREKPRQPEKGDKNKGNGDNKTNNRL